MSRIFKIEELNKYINRLLSEDVFLSNIKVSGEISNFTHHSSGHMYFSIKDKKSKLKCIMFKSRNKDLDLELSDGLEIIATGNIEVYEPEGVYQLYVKNIEIEGAGDLFLQFTELKKKLDEAGLFDSIYKKEIPKYPNRIGIITSTTGAAIQDILNVIKRRYPIASIYIYPSLVQGKEAVEDVKKGLILLDNYNLDTIILARGGGAIEDLHVFNDEEMAKIIFAMNTPIITGIGHEIDFTIADFVSDLRAPTPSAAAELATPDINNLKLDLNNNIAEIISNVDYKMRNLNRDLDIIYKDIKFNSPQNLVNNYYQDLDYKYDRLKNITRLKDERNKIDILAHRLNSLDPNAALNKGYSILMDENRKIVKEIDKINDNELYTIKLRDGEIVFNFDFYEEGDE